MGAVYMSQREWRRAACLGRVREGSITLQVAAEEMGLSYRQAKRLWRRYLKEGDEGLRHGLRGRASNHGSSLARERVLALMRGPYDGFGPTLAAEHLAKDGLHVDHETLRRWMVREGMWERHRKRRPYRRRRQRKASWGEMVQMDGSPHDWFEGRGPRCVLMVMIDDATNRTLARFFPEETTEAAYRVFEAYVGRHGLPQSLYVDRDSIYREPRQPTTQEALAGEEPLTQFGRAMKELGVQLICAHSPQAKGRVERRHGLLQDRLVKEMRLQGIADIAAANAYLAKTFLRDLNRRFTVPPLHPGDGHRPVPPGVKLAEVLSWQEERVVHNDWTVHWHNRCFQVDARERKQNLAGKTVLVRELLDGTIQLVYGGRKLAWTELQQRPTRPEAQPRRLRGNQPGRTPWKPAADHPWRGRAQTLTNKPSTEL
jgi:transposase-like protein